MSHPAQKPEATLDIVEGSGARRSVSVSQSPFLIGRSGENHLSFKGRDVSRLAAEIVFESGQFRLEDAGQHGGLFVNGRKVEQSVPIQEGDVITFGRSDALHLVFHGGPNKPSLGALLSRLDDSTVLGTGNRKLHQLNLLLEATALLHAQLPIGEVLASMVDQAIAVANADRGLLFDVDAGGNLNPAVGRHRKKHALPVDSLIPSQTIIDRALSARGRVIEEDVHLASDVVRQAASLVGQQLRSAIAIPLYARPKADSDSRGPGEEDPLLGLIYMDSRRPSAFNDLDRQVLDALAIEAASVIDTAGMVESERRRRQLEQDLHTAREIQKTLLPKELKGYPFLDAAGSHEPCLAVGGDYFDMLELGPERVLFVVADVAGKGLSAALLTATLQGGLAGITVASETARLLNHVNDYIWARSESNRYATAFLGLVDQAGSMDVINAGHHSALLVRQGEISAPFESDGFPIGMFRDVGYRSRSFQLEGGDTLVVFTDGINEAENPAGEEYGVERLMEAALRNSGASVDEVRTAILGEVLEFCQGAPQKDDMTVLVVRYLG